MNYQKMTKSQLIDEIKRLNDLLDQKNNRGAGRKPKFTDLERMAIIADLQAGEQREKICVKYGCSMSTLNRLIADYTFTR